MLELDITIVMSTKPSRHAYATLLLYIAAVKQNVPFQYAMYRRKRRAASSVDAGASPVESAAAPPPHTGHLILLAQLPVTLVLVSLLLKPLG
jgi:hypothetical protein